MRVLIMGALFIGLAGYFFYDWQVGYPKKNYKLVQYNTFQQARTAFLKHHEMERSAQQWQEFVAEQEIAYHDNHEMFPSKHHNERWPQELLNYNSMAAGSKSDEQSALWSQFLASRQADLAELKSGFSDPMTKEDRRALKSTFKWDLPLPSEFEKGEDDANYRLLIYRTFEKAQKQFKSAQAAGKTAQDWAFYTSYQRLAFEQDQSVIPAKHVGEKWPAILADYDTYYALAKDDIETGKSIKDPYLWKEFTSDQKWGETPPKAMKGSDAIAEQLYYGVGLCTLTLLAGLVALWMKSRYMAVDDTAYYAPGNKKIPYDQIYKIDKRKWETKGLATLYYNDGENKKKARVDGMVYGQFDKAQGEPAECLFQEIMKNFKGEVIELVQDEGDQLAQEA